MSFIMTNNSTSTTLTGAGTIPLGSAVHGCGRGIVLNGNNIVLSGSGYYRINSVVNASITGTDAVTVSLVQDGTILDSATITPSGAGANVQFAIPWIIRKPCGCNSSNLSLTISAGATITNVTMIVEGGK